MFSFTFLQLNAGPDLGGGPGGPRPPTIEGPPTKLLIFYFLLMNQLMTSLQMFYCNLRVLQCTEIAVQEDFACPKYDFWRNRFKGGAKNFLGSLSLAIFYVPLIHYYIIRPLPQTPQSAGRGVPPLHHPSRRLRHLDPWHLRCLEFGPPLFRPKLCRWLGPRPPTS